MRRADRVTMRLAVVVLMLLGACASSPDNLDSVPVALRPYADAAQFLPPGFQSYAFGIDVIYYAGEPDRHRTVLAAKAGSDFEHGHSRSVKVLDFGPDGLKSYFKTDPGPPKESIHGVPVWFRGPVMSSVILGESHWWTLVAGRYWIESHDHDVLEQSLARPGNLADVLRPFPRVADIPDDADHVVCLSARPADQAKPERRASVETMVVASSMRSRRLVAFHQRPLPQEFTKPLTLYWESPVPSSETHGDWTRTEFLLRQGVSVQLLFDAFFGYGIYL